jgi:outer membrane protein OmpA-like peptidoglycan-associated protein
VSPSTDPLEWLLKPAAQDIGIDRKALAGLLLDIARNVKPELHPPPPVDFRMQKLRTLLLGREIELLARLSEIVEDPEQLALAVGRILPTAFALASSDARLGQVLAPSLEKATQSSIRNDPRTLVNILYPLIVPAIRKSIGETIDQTFQSLNETLKHSLTWRGLRWRWEAWRTGRSFAEVVLNHSLVYQVEHVFLIHRHTGLLISHVAAENAASQDPQLVSSMLSAIQDFVRDSFSGAEHQGLDTLRLGDLTVWCEPGPFATLVAVIRGKPPEEMHQTLGSVLSRVHAERHHALEDFDGDSGGFTDIEAELTSCVALRQTAPQRAQKVSWLFAPVALVALAVLSLVTAWGVRRWQDDRRWENYVATLQAQPGIVVTRTASQDGKFTLAGLRDPLAADPQVLLKATEIDPRRVVESWAPYQALDARIALKRLQTLLDPPLEPPAEVTLAIDGERIVARGTAPSAWLDRARSAASMLPAGAPQFDFAGVLNEDAESDERWDNYLVRLRAQPGIVVIEAGRREGIYTVSGLRDPLAIDPRELLAAAGLDPKHVIFHWVPYQGLDAEIVLRRLQALLNPPSSVIFTVQGDRVVAQGLAPGLWLERARAAGRMLPMGAPGFDLSGVQTVSDAALGSLRAAIQSHTIRFNQNEPLPAPGQDAVLDQLAGALSDLATLAASLHVNTRVTMTGHADAVGQGTLNLSLSLARAEVVRALLKKRGVNPDQLAVRGAGALEPLSPEASDAARSANRRVSFNVDVEEQP